MREKQNTKNQVDQWKWLQIWKTQYFNGAFKLNSVHKLIKQNLWYVIVSRAGKMHSSDNLADLFNNGFKKDKPN